MKLDNKALDELCALAKKQLPKLVWPIQLKGQRLVLYRAGIKRAGNKPDFGLFPRDLLSSALMFQDSQLLRDTLTFCILTQGKKKDKRTGEERGKIIHEWPEVFFPSGIRGVRELSTKYNASDTAALFLIGLDYYNKHMAEERFVSSAAPAVNAGLDYIFDHITPEGLFQEDPAACGAVRFALKVTYWKDSILPLRRDSEPHYPVAYALLQAQVAAGLRAAVRLAKEFKLSYSSAELARLAKKVAGRVFTDFWDSEKKCLFIAIDKAGPVAGLSSDGLHALHFLEQGDVPKSKLGALCESAVGLTTPYGFRTYAPKQPKYSPGAYHLGSVWPREQPLIAEGALRFHKPEIAEVCFGSLAALKKLQGFPELLVYNDSHNGSLRPGGCALLLWSAAVPLAMKGLLSRFPKKLKFKI